MALAAAAWDGQADTGLCDTWDTGISLSAGMLGEDGTGDIVVGQGTLR